MTVMDALQWANARLRERADARFDSPMLDAEILLADVLGLPKAKLFLRGMHPLSPAVLERFRRLVERRAAGEPVAYLVGRKAFFGRTFAVNPFTLIPRPATETLVEAALEDAQAGDPSSTLLADVGTGSGAIAVTLAAETGLPVVASDISRHALCVARTNAETHGVAERVDFRHGDGWEPVGRLFHAMRAARKRPAFERLVLCANLPYLPDGRWQDLQPDVRREPRLALTSGPDGLDAYWRFLRALKAGRTALPHHLSLLLEMDPDQAETLPALVRRHFPLADVSVRTDLEGHARVVVARGL